MNNSEYKTKDINGEDTVIENNHAYAIKRADEDTITFINPHDTSTEITIDRDELVNIEDFQLYDLDFSAD